MSFVSNMVDYFSRGCDYQNLCLASHFVSASADSLKEKIKKNEDSISSLSVKATHAMTFVEILKEANGNRGKVPSSVVEAFLEADVPMNGNVIDLSFWNQIKVTRIKFENVIKKWAEEIRVLEVENQKLREEIENLDYVSKSLKVIRLIEKFLHTPK